MTYNFSGESNFSSQHADFFSSIVNIFKIIPYELCFWSLAFLFIWDERPLYMTFDFIYPPIENRVKEVYERVIFDRDLFKETAKNYLAILRKAQPFVTE